MQEFISDQFLIHGYSFKIGVNVLITSIDPLRFYMNLHDVHPTLAPQKFSLDDLNNTQNYMTDGHKEVLVKKFWKVRQDFVCCYS